MDFIFSHRASSNIGWCEACVQSQPGGLRKGNFLTTIDCVLTRISYDLGRSPTGTSKLRSTGQLFFYLLITYLLNSLAFLRELS